MANTDSTTPRGRLATKADFRLGMGIFAVLFIGAIALMQVDFGTDSNAAPQTLDATSSFAGGQTMRCPPSESR